MFTKFVSLVFFLVSRAIADDSSIQSSVGSMIEIGTGVSAPVATDENPEVSLLLHVSIGRVHRNGSRRPLIPIGRVIGRISADLALSPGVSGDTSLNWLEVEVVPVTLSVNEAESERGFISITAVTGVTHVSSQIDLGNRYYATIDLLGLSIARGGVAHSLNAGQIQIIFDAMISGVGATWGRLSRTHDVEGATETYRVGDGEGALLSGQSWRGSTRLLFNLLLGTQFRVSLSQSASVRLGNADLNVQRHSGGASFRAEAVRFESNLATRLEVQFRNAWNVFVEYRRQGIRIGDLESNERVSPGDFNGSGYENHQHQLMGGVLYVY